MKALVTPGGRVAQVAANVFPVSKSLKWVDCDESVTTHHKWDGISFVPPPTPSAREAIKISALEDVPGDDASMRALKAFLRKAFQ